MGEWRLSMTMIGVLFAISFVTFVVLMFIPAPYGRHVRPGWGPVIPARVSWIAMETPAVLVFAWAFFAGERWFHPAPLALFALWQMHYVHRTFVFPFRTHGGKIFASKMLSAGFRPPYCSGLPHCLRITSSIPCAAFSGGRTRLSITPKRVKCTQSDGIPLNILVMI
jgi:hypothetical protein